MLRRRQKKQLSRLFQLSSKMSKSFTENFVHGGEAILSEKWPFSSLVEPLPDEKSGRKRRRIAHRPCFCARFLLKFCCFSRFCKHAKFSKVNAKFSKVVDFFFSTSPFFCHNLLNRLIINNLANPQKTGLFSSKSFFVENFRNMEAKNGCFVNIFQNKSVQENCRMRIPASASLWMMRVRQSFVILSYLFPFALLCVLHSIWQLSISVEPPLLHAVTWSASISLNL